MERPDFFNFDRNQGTQPEGGIQTRAPEVTRLAGHLTVAERAGTESAPHRAPAKAVETVIAAALQPETGKDVQFSAWHRIEKDDQGNVKSLAEQNYGKALLHEMDAEQGMPTSQSSNTTNPQGSSNGSSVAPASRPTQMHSPAAYAAPSPQQTPPQHASDDQVIVLPQFSHNPRGAHNVQPQATTQPQAQSHAQQQFVSPQFSAHAVNPATPASDHQLPSGNLTQDPEHMLPTAKKRGVGTILKSPWFWLVVGIGLVVYFI